MGRPRKNADPDAPEPAAFVETEGTSAAPRPKSVRLKHRDGKILWNEMSDSQLLDFQELVKRDPQARQLLEGDEPKPALITEHHVCQFLDLLSLTECLAVPWIVKRKTGKELHPPIVQRAFTFSAETKAKLGPPGAQHFNDVLPEAWKLAIAKIGPGSEFWGGLLTTIYAQTQLCFALQTQHDKTQQSDQVVAPAGSNGGAHAVEEPE